MRQLKIPYHLPENRAIANATQRTGPTKDDYKAMLYYKTPLFADSLASNNEPGFNFSSDPRRSMYHDLEFGSSLRTSTCLDTFTYTPGTITGVWEGIYQVSSRVYLPLKITSNIICQTADIPTRNTRRSTPINSATEMSFIWAMQFALTEYICVSSEEKGDASCDDDIHACALDFFHKQVI